MSTASDISVVIPALNEEDDLPDTLASIRKSRQSTEVIVVDGGSSDNTVKVAEAAGAAVITSSISQRAAQMNLGAANSAGHILLFLHADTHLPESGLEEILDALKVSETIGGAFARRFAHDAPFLRFTCALADLRSAAIGWFLGDQGIFVRRTVFDSIGGFEEMDCFEDLDFSRRMKKAGRTVLLKPPVVSSGRRFERHPVTRTFKDLGLTLRFLCKGPPDSSQE